MYGDGPEDELALEASGDYTRKVGYIKISDYNNDTKNGKSSSNNTLNNIWYRPEETFPVNGTPEVRQHVFWVPVDNHYFSLAKRLERYGDGPEDELALEASGDYTRKVGYIKISDYNNDTKNGKSSSNNTLNNIWYRPEETFPVNGTPEVRQHVFWVPVDDHYFSLAKRLEGMKLGRCVNSTCLPRTPIVTSVTRRISANVVVDNRSYREFLFSKFNATAINMESAAVALVSHQQKKPFIAIRALFDLAGGGSSVSNEAAIFASLAAQNAVDVLVQFITLLS
ncbi:unnamed protein product [Camellia sinensis]